MPREAEPSSVERAFLLEALRQNVRVDGRPFDQYRRLDLAFGEEVGTATVSLGETRVHVQVAAEMTKPLEDRKFDGIFTVSTELSPIASPAFEIGRQTEQEVMLSRILEKAIRRSNAIDTESLCIIAGAKCWSVRADVHVLDFDGGLVDASCIGIMAALQHFRRPEVSVDGEDVTIYTLAERVPLPLSLKHEPVCVTFSFYHNGDVVLLDASLREEQVREGEMVITMNRHGEVFQIAKLGGVSVDAMTLLKCTTTALTKVKEIGDFVSRKLNEDATKRSVGTLIDEMSAENER